MFSDYTQRNKVISTIFGAFGAAAWCHEEEGLQPRALKHYEEYKKRDKEDDVQLHTSARFMFLFAVGINDSYVKVNLKNGLDYLDGANRRLITTLVYAMGKDESVQAIDEWLARNARYRTYAHRQ